MCQYTNLKLSIFINLLKSNLNLCYFCLCIQVFDISSLQIFTPQELDYLLCGRRELWEVILTNHAITNYSYSDLPCCMKINNLSLTSAGWYACGSYKIWPWIYCKEPCYSLCMIPFITIIFVICMRYQPILLDPKTSSFFSYLKLWESLHLSSNVPSVNSLLEHLGFHLGGLLCWIQSWLLWERYSIEILLDDNPRKKDYTLKKHPH